MAYRIDGKLLLMSDDIRCSSTCIKQMMTLEKESNKTTLAVCCHALETSRTPFRQSNADVNA